MYFKQLIFFTFLAPVFGSVLPEPYSSAPLLHSDNALDPRQTACPAIWSEIATNLKQVYANCNNAARSAIRFAFHDAAGYSSLTVPYGPATGGADGSLLLNDEEIARSDNNPLQVFRANLLRSYNAYKDRGVGAADFVQFAGVIGTKSCPGGPVYKTVRWYIDLSYLNLSSLPLPGHWSQRRFHRKPTRSSSSGIWSQLECFRTPCSLGCQGLQRTRVSRFARRALCLPGVFSTSEQHSCRRFATYLRRPLPSSNHDMQALKIQPLRAGTPTTSKRLKTAQHSGFSASTRTRILPSWELLLDRHSRSSVTTSIRGAWRGKRPCTSSAFSGFRRARSPH